MKFPSTQLYKKHNFFHRWNPFNAALKNRLVNTLGITGNISQNTYTSPLLNQGDLPDCMEYCDAATVAAITGQPCDPNLILENVLTYLNQTQSQYEGCDLKTGMSVIINPGTPNYSYAAILYIYPENGESFCETINGYIQQYKRPANLGGVWYNEFFGSQNGIVPSGAKILLGGHAMMLCGIGSDDCMLNQGSWGTIPAGSDGGFYRFSPSVFDSYYTGYPCGIGIDSTDTLVILLGKLSAAYVELIDRIGELGQMLTRW